MRFRILLSVLMLIVVAQTAMANLPDQINQSKVNDENARPFWLLLNFSSGITIPSGDYYDGMKSGLALGGGISIPISRRLGIKFSAGRAGVLKDDRSVFLINDEPSIEFQDVKMETYLMRYLIALEFRNRSDNSAKNGDSYWYFYSGFGGINNKMTLEYREFDLLDGSGINHRITGDDWDLIASMGAGMMFAAGSSIGLDVSFNWDMIVAKSSYSEVFIGKIDERYGISGYLLELRIGLYKTF